MSEDTIADSLQPLFLKGGRFHGLYEAPQEASIEALVCRVCKHQLELGFEHVPDRLPVHARRLHRDMRAALSFQPGRQLQQALRRRLERPHLLGDLPIIHDPNAGRDRLLMHVEASTAPVQHFHDSLPCCGGVESPKGEI
jgi:hypothetical protein